MDYLAIQEGATIELSRMQREVWLMEDSMGIERNHRLPFPNGKGYTPCTKEYLLTKHERDAIYDPNDEDRFLKDLDSDEYQRWSELDDALAQMQLQGHLGTSVRF